MQLGERHFTDGTTCPVYRSGNRRQYVLDDDGEPVYGVWLHPDEYREPIEVEFFQIVDGRLILQHNQKAWGLWIKDVPGNLQRADANWPSLVQQNGK